MDDEAKKLLHQLVYQPADERIQRLSRERDEGFKGKVDFYEGVLRNVSPRYHAELVRFAETGEASPEFMAYLDDDNAENKQARKAIERVIEAMANELMEFGKALREEISLEKKVKE